MTKAVRLRIGMIVILAGALALGTTIVHRHRQSDRATLARLRADLAAATLDREVAEVALIEYDEGLRYRGRAAIVRPAPDAEQERTLGELRAKIGSRAREEAARRARVDGFEATHRGL